MSNTKVIIYIQVHNGGKHLRACLDSVLNQSYTNFEVVICDNGSKDNTAKLINLYAKKHPQITPYIFEDNILYRWSNLINSWDNNCYFTALDADDYLEKDYLSTLITLLEEHDLDMSVASSVTLHEMSKNKIVRQQNIYQDTILQADNITNDYWLYRFALSTSWGYIAKVSLLKNIIPTIASINEANIILNSGAIVTLNYINQCNKIGLSKDILYNYRIHKHNSSSFKAFKYNSLVFTSIAMLFNEYEKFAPANKNLPKLYWEFIDDVFLRIHKAFPEPDVKLAYYIEVFSHELTTKYLNHAKTLDANSKLHLITALKFVYDTGSNEEKALAETIFEIVG